MMVGRLTDTCLRCGESTDGHFGALSRTDNSTLVCDACGVLEGMEQHYFGSPMGKEFWQGVTVNMCMNCHAVFSGEGDCPKCGNIDRTEGAL